MRYIPSLCLRAGQKTAKDLFFGENQVLLAKGTVLTDYYINRIRELGVQGIYIDDEISQDIEIASVISDGLRDKARAEIKKILTKVENSDSRKVDISRDINSVRAVLSNIVDEIVNNRNVMANMVDIKTYDDYIFAHCVNVGVLSIIIGVERDMSKSELCCLGLGAMLHDIGKVFIDKSIINKNGPLSDEELEKIKKHSEDGYKYLGKHWDLAESSKLGVLLHHEKYDGTGYPLGLSGSKIHPYGRIICVCDIYDALTSDRPYRKALLPSEAMEYIMGGMGSLFDPETVKIFSQKISPYPLGTRVLLSTGEQGIVVNNYSKTCLRPLIRLIENEKPTDRYIDLTNDKNSLSVTIVGVINS